MIKLARRSAFAFALGALLLALAYGGWKWWRSGEELRRELAPPALPGPQHVALDCRSLPRERLMVVLVLGQSNSANHAQTRAEGGEGVYSWHEGRCYPAVDPLPGASGDQGSLWTRLGRAIVDSGARDTVLFVPLGITTTSVAQWAHHPVLVQRLRRSVQALQGGGLAATHVIWYQGEADSFKQTAPEDYRRDFRVVLDRLLSLGVTAPVWVAQSTLCQTRRNPAVREVQAELPRQLPGVRAGPDMDALFGPAHRYNGCHFGAGSAPVAAEAWRRALFAGEDAGKGSR